MINLLWSNQMKMIGSHRDELSHQLVAHYNILTRITQLGMVISLICLFMCIFTFWFFSEIQSTRTTIHKNLCCSLFMAEFIFLVGINMHSHKVSPLMRLSVLTKTLFCMDGQKDVNIWFIMILFTLESRYCSILFQFPHSFSFLLMKTCLPSTSALD